VTVKIKKINITAFRGIPNLELELDGRSLILHGENGTGKSSIVDAIEFFFTGKVSHLKGTRGLSLRQHGPHVNFTPDDISIVITFNPGNISLTRTFSSAPTPPEQFKDYFQITQKGTFILRRSQILEFILSQPAERFRAIGSIIGIESLDRIELEMKRLHEELRDEVRSRERKIREILQNISDVLGRNINNIAELLPALNEKLQEADLPLIESLESLTEKEIYDHFNDLLKTEKNKATLINTINEVLKIPSIPQEIINELKDINKEIEYLLQDQVRIDRSICNLLESGKNVIEREKMGICPLCEQKINREKLLSKIEARLKTLRELSDKAGEIREKLSRIVTTLEEISDKFVDIISKIELVPELSEEREAFQSKLNLLNAYIEKIRDAKNLENKIPVEQISQLKEEINKLGNSAREKCTRLLKEATLTEEEKRTLSTIRLIEVILNAREVQRVSQELQTYKKYSYLAEKIYTSFSHSKRSKIQEIYNAIENGIQNFYSTLHPNEPHTNIRLIVDPDRRASTKIKIDSFGREGEDPRALTSEGHLDSLGLCIFLAFVKRFNEGCSLMILDDVVR